MTDTELEQQREHFNSIAGRYREARAGKAHQELKRLLWTDSFNKAAVALPPDAQVLEAMCGFAEGKKLLELCFDTSFSYAGFDYSDEVVAGLKKTHPELEIFQADATSFESAKQYDVIILIGGLHHVPRYAGDVVQRLANALKPNGLFVNLEPTHGNKITELVRNRIYRQNDLFDEETEEAFAVANLSAMFSASGLEEAHVTYPGLLAYVLYYNPDAFPGLNKGGINWVRRLYRLESWLYPTFIGRLFSFATLSIWRKP